MTRFITGLITAVSGGITRQSFISRLEKRPLPRSDRPRNRGLNEWFACPRPISARRAFAPLLASPRHASLSPPASTSAAATAARGPARIADRRANHRFSWSRPSGPDSGPCFDRGVIKGNHRWLRCAAPLPSSSSPLPPLSRVLPPSSSLLSFPRLALRVRVRMCRCNVVARVYVHAFSRRVHALRPPRGGRVRGEGGFDERALRVRSSVTVSLPGSSIFVSHGLTCFHRDRADATDIKCLQAISA